MMKVHLKGWDNLLQTGLGHHLKSLTSQVRQMTSHKFNNFLKHSLPPGLHFVTSNYWHYKLKKFNFATLQSFFLLVRSFVLQTLSIKLLRIIITGVRRHTSWFGHSRPPALSPTTKHPPQFFCHKLFGQKNLWSPTQYFKHMFTHSKILQLQFCS